MTTTAQNPSTNSQPKVQDKQPKVQNNPTNNPGSQQKAQVNQLKSRDFQSEGQDHLEQLGIFGYQHLEPFILTSLLTQTPLLLIGASGTGKTMLLNRISEALQLNHRHYNASLISFDDLIGFPFPNEEKTTIKFLPSPASVWDAQSLLVDEISRCAPEIQNKFFSLLHERKLQGIALQHLTYRWAAMNPIHQDLDTADHNYQGSQPLDPALADRFGFLLEVPDWNDLSKTHQLNILDHQATLLHPRKAEKFQQLITALHKDYQKKPPTPSLKIKEYTRLMALWLLKAEYRLSPRRVQIITQNLTTHQWLMQYLNRPTNTNDWKEIIRWSLPHRAWKGTLPDHPIETAHRKVLQLLKGKNEKEKWINEFLYETNPIKRMQLLSETPIDRDTRSLAIIQLLYQESTEIAAIFAFTLWPLAVQSDFFNPEAVQEISKRAQPIFEIEGELQWRSHISDTNSFHPDWSACLQVINQLEGQRKNRIRQLCLHLLIQGIPIPYPQVLETELQQIFEQAQQLFQKIPQYA